MPGSGPRWVLVVEDEEVLRKVLQRRLEMEGFRVLGAATGEEALELAERRAFDAVLLDNGLPGKTGLLVLPELCRILQVPVLMITGYPNEDVEKDARLLGAVGVLPKPFDLDELVRRLRAMV